MNGFPMRWIACVCIGLLAVAGADAQVLREGAGERRAALDKMELTTFDHGIWTKLTDWRNGPMLTGAEADGKVVLILTWSNWYNLAMRVIPMTQRLHEKYADHGLIIVGAHHARGWDEAHDAAKKAGMTFRYAHDAKSEFRDALLVDQDPDYYVIDRAGRLRYADIQTSSVETAVEELIRETKQQAMNLPEMLEALRQAEEEAARRTRLIRQNIDIAQMPDLPFPRPTQTDYERARWPTRWREFEERVMQMQRQFGQQGDTPEAIQVSLPGATDPVWFGKPLKTAGRAIVLYWWVPDFQASYERVQPQMDMLQRERIRDVSVVGILTPRNRPGSDQFGQSSQEEQERQRREFERLVSRAKTQRIYDHSIVVDAEWNIINQIMQNSSSQVLPVPLAAILSTDNNLRWIGPPDDNRFIAALDRVLSEDPAVKARRRVEQEWIRTHQPQDP